MNELCEGVLNAAGTAAWQIAVVAAAAWALATLFGRRRPHFAAVLWTIVIAKALTPTVWTNSFNVWSWTAPRPASPVEIPAVAGTPIRETVADAVLLSTSSAEPQRATTRPASVVSPVDSPPVPQARNHTTSSIVATEKAPMVVAWQTVCMGVWIAGAIVSAGVVGFRLLRLRRRLAGSVPSSELTARAMALGGSPRTIRRVRFQISENLGPATCGVIRPIVVVPSGLVESLPAEGLDAILAHELTHLRRGDVLLGWVQTLAGVIWWFHPALWFANRRLSQAVEQCCDAETVRRLGCAPADYARTLVAVMERMAVAKPIPATVGARSFHGAVHRVRQVLELKGGLPGRTPRWCFPILIAGLAVILPAGAPPAAQDQTAAETDTTSAPDKSADATSGDPAAETETKVSRLISPDGRRIAYGQVAVGPQGDQTVRIIVGNADGTQRHALPIDAHSVDEVQWYGNNRIAYVTEHGEDGYFLMTLDGKPAGELRMPGGCDSFFHQCLSPDGKKIAYCGNYFETNERFASQEDRRKFLKTHPEVKAQHGVFVVDLESQTVKHLLSETVANLPAWSPDSRFLACGIGHYTSHYPLAILNVESGEVLRPDDEGVGPAWSPDNKQLAMTTSIIAGGSWRGGIPLDGALGVWTVEEESLSIVSPWPTNVSIKEPRSRTYSGAHAPVWSPDGKWIAYTWSEFVSGKDGKSAREEIRVVRSNGQDERKVLDHRCDELAWSADGRELLWVHDGRFGRVQWENPEVSETTPAEPEGRWVVRGRVTDEEGRPMEGVAIKVFRGLATLFPSAPVLTDAEGRYEARFGPGYLQSGNGPKLQPALVQASRAGYFEKNLCAQGRLGMAEYRSDEGDETGYVDVVYPGHPLEVNFVMLQGGSATVELVDASGQPLKDFRITLDGETLSPGSSVEAVESSDANGSARFADIPRQSYWFALDSRSVEYKTEPFTFDEPGEYRFRLTYDDIEGTLTAQCTARP